MLSAPIGAGCADCVGWEIGLDMKYLITGICFFLSCFRFIETQAVGLNEWSFDMDAAGLTLSQATNSGTQSAVFSAGGEDFLETDGADTLRCTRTADNTNEMWTGGAILDADIPDVSSGVYYLRYDCNYDLTNTNGLGGSVFGLGVIDESGNNIAGAFLAKGSTNSPPDREMRCISLLPSSGQVSVILKVDTDTEIASVWYTLESNSSFDENLPAISDVPIALSSIDKLRFQATGDFRPEGSDNYAAADHIRTASTWEEITQLTSIPLSVHTLFQNHAVLQRDRDVPVWGRLTPGMEVAVKLDGVPVGTAVADKTGHWITGIGSHAADGGQSHILQITAGGKSIQFDGIVFGDVYLASGQSNMEFPMEGFAAGPATGYSEELAVADSFSLIRHTAVSRTDSAAELEEPELRINWTKCSRTTLGEFSAVGYFFAKRIYEETGVPVGLLLAAWGGQLIDRFISPSGWQAVPELSGMVQAEEEGNITDTDFSDIYNGMIAPLIPYGIRGVLWYQGEANANKFHDGDIYRLKMIALMRGWRQNWNQGNFPFYYVQLADFNAAASAAWAGLRSAQTAALSEMNSGMAVAIDIGDGSDIHPLNKYDIGRRLARWALVKDYGQNTTYSGPLYRRSILEGSNLRLLFDYVDKGLMIGNKNGTNDIIEAAGPLQNFEIAGADKNFTSAVAVIGRDTVVVSSPSVSSPLYARYGYASSPAGSNKLYNTSGLPASPFRTDESYELDIVSGSGAAAGLAAGTDVTITASAVAGKVFDRWVGAASEIDNVNASTATVTIPHHDLYLLATYRDAADPVYTLTVNGGFGSGASQAGSVLNIEASVLQNREFDHWTGDTQTVVNVNASVTTLRMPSNNVAVTAVYHVTDSVGDGIDDKWRAVYFGGDGSTTNGQSVAGADPDGDRMTNKEEFYAGTSPLDNTSAFTLDRSISAGELVLHFQSVSGHRYRLEKTDMLTPIDWRTVRYNMTGDDRPKDIPLIIENESSGFYRLRLN